MLSHNIAFPTWASYEFNTSDILCAKDVLKMFTRNFDDLPWDALIYVTGHVNYGGESFISITAGNPLRKISLFKVLVSFFDTEFSRCISFMPMICYSS